MKPERTKNRAGTAMPEKTYVFILRISGQEVWKVRWRGQITSPDFNSRGAALSYLDMLRRGPRKAEVGQ